MPHRCAVVLLCGDRPRRPPKCRERRICVTNTPDFLTDEVAGLAISVPRKTMQADRYVHAGLWKARGTTQSPCGLKFFHDERCVLIRSLLDLGK
uniref:Uncharacterized protein n=1 Tax=Aegilops tauschii subsp. strangulata TaxID=200361 RepID=A0A453G3U7_AEGTS